MMSRPGKGHAAGGAVSASFLPSASPFFISGGVIYLYL